MRRILRLAAAAASGFAMAGAASASGQMHKVAAPEEVVRAVGVYEWTGDRAKPTASRLIPVTLFIDGELQDAGVYLARPVPFAIDSGTVYEIDKAGVAEGTLDVKYATHLQAADTAANYDDGWFGYGTFALPPPPKKVAALKVSTNLPKVESSRADIDSDRPTLVRRHGSSSDDSSSASDPKSGSSATTTASPAPPDDPDRPHLTRRPDSSSPSTQPAGSDTSASTPTSANTPSDTSADKTPASGNTGSAPAGDPDRPTLKKRTPEEAKKARQEALSSSATGLATSLNDDPNRPTLHRGKGQQALTEADLPKLKGLPVGIHQAVAVSDAKNRPVHDFSRPWADDAERATILAKMQALARAQIAAYQTTAAAAAPPSATKQATTRPPNSKVRHSTSKESVSQPPLPLEDEQLNGYTLSYGGAPTYVYTAHTPGDGASLRYVTVVAQTDTFGNLQPAIQSVTDAAHLDRTPWMRLVDVVDVDASNRASLLFEMRGQSARQFALYRVIAARAEQTFLSGTTQ
jgi:hypothetical protein